MEYNEQSIQVLDDLAHMRLRKGMYIGEALDPRQLLSEVFDNAIDEVQAGFSDKLIVKIDTTQNKYSVRDFGRGIPHGKKTLEGGVEKEVVEVLITKANSGGKFNNSSYNYSSGLNGLGLTITNALSTEIRLVSYRAGKAVQAVAHGTSEVEVTYFETGELDGTLVEFIPDKKMFHSAKVPVEFIKDRCCVARALGFKAELFIDEAQVNTDAKIFDLIKEENTVSIYVDVDTIEVTNAKQEKMKVALRYTSETNDRYFGYTNLLSNYLGGTHTQELSKTISATWRRFIDDHRNIRLGVELKNTDFLIGLRAVCAVFISNPEFSSQTKEKLVVNKKYFEELMSLFSDKLYKYLEDNILTAQQLIKRFEEYRIAQNNLLSRREISSLIKVNTDSADNIRRRSVVSKLVECTSKKREGTEIFICEGDSALGPYMYVRDKATQAILPLRGKILNVTYKSIKEAVKNKEICDIANSLGCGIGTACDASKSRYERVIISADADPDGLQINCLVLSVFVNLFPDMVRAGRVYVSLPPLYSWGTSEKDFGWTNDISKVPKNVKGFAHFKGLGEMNPNQLEYFLVRKETRNVMQISFPSDIDEFNRILGTSTGKNELMRELGILEVGQ